MIRNLLDRMKLPFRKNKEFVRALYDILGFYPHDVNLYRVAFSHRSLGRRTEVVVGKDGKRRYRKQRENESEETKPLNNERLEYLGDAVLETVVSDILFQRFPTKREGFLTSTRSKIVQREALNRLAEDMGLDKLILAAHGTKVSRTNIGGNAFEALMGAIYLDQGFSCCHRFIANRVIGRFVDVENVAQKEVNFKSKLLEWSQKNRIRIVFNDKAGERGDRGFSTTILLEDIVIGHGTGRAKKDSQQQAAKEALTRMRRDPKLYESIFSAKEKRTAMEAEESFALPKIDEIEKIIASKPAREKERTKKSAAPKLEKPDTRTDIEAAFDMAYDTEAKFEVIDKVEEEPLPTIEDFERLGLPAPPSDDDLHTEDEEGKKQLSHRNKREKKNEPSNNDKIKQEKPKTVSREKTERSQQSESDVKEKAERRSHRERKPKAEETATIIIEKAETPVAEETHLLEPIEEVVPETNPGVIIAEPTTETTPEVKEDAAIANALTLDEPKEEETAVPEDIAQAADETVVTPKTEATEYISEEPFSAAEEKFEDEKAETKPPVESTFTEPVVRPILRHLSIDDVIFDSDHPALDEDTEDEDTENMLTEERPKARPYRRRRRPAAKTNSADNHKEEATAEKPRHNRPKQAEEDTTKETAPKAKSSSRRRRRPSGNKPTPSTEE